MKSTKVTHFFYVFLVGTLYSFSLGLSVISTTVLPISGGEMLFWCALFTLVFYAIFLNRYTVTATLGLLVVCGVVVFLSLRGDRSPLWFQSLEELAGRLALFFTRQADYDPGFNTPVCMCLALLLALYGSLFIHVWFNFYFLLFLGVALIAVPPMLAFDQSPGPTLLFVLCVVILLARELNWMSVERHIRSNSGAGLRLLPLCLAVFLLAWLLPKPSGSADPYVLMAGNDLLGISGGEGGGESTDSSALGGPNNPGTDAVMRVFADERLYLAGAIYDRYTGSSWEVSGDAITFLPTTGTGAAIVSQSLYDQMEGSESIYSIDLEILEAYGITDVDVIAEVAGGIEGREAVIFPTTSTHRVFLAGGTAVISPSEENSFQANAQGAVTAESSLDPATPYTLLYTPENRDAVREGLVSRPAYNPDYFSDYLQLPDTVPQRVYDLSWSMLSESENTYAFLTGLQEYLADFPYTLDAADLPAGEDFVDFFLFSAQSGYCTSYASAMVVLARAAGVPARYVEGYIMPTGADGDGGYTVTQRNAHAWAEIYVQDIGWVIFEATAPYYSAVDEDEPEETPEPTESLPELTPQPTAEATPESGAVQEEPEEESRAWGGRAVLICLVAVLLILAVILAYRVRLYIPFGLWRAGRLPEREAVLAYFTLILRVLGRANMPIGSRETALMYARRLGLDGLEAAAALFGRAAYGDEAISAEDQAQMDRLAREIIAAARAKRA